MQVQTRLDFPHRVSFDWTWRYASDLRAGPVPAYSTSNVRVSWRPRAGLEFAINGKDLHEARHPEWPAGAGGNVLIRRTVFAGLTFRR